MKRKSPQVRRTLGYQLTGVLPKTYNLFTSTLLKELLRKVSEIPASLDFDAFGRSYEYFLGEFATSEGQGGGEFHTPPKSSSLARAKPIQNSPAGGGRASNLGMRNENPVRGAAAKHTAPAR